MTVEEASIEIYTRVSGGFRVGKNSQPKVRRRYISLKLPGSDVERTRKPVVIWWFVSENKVITLSITGRKNLNEERALRLRQMGMGFTAKTYGLKITNRTMNSKFLPI